jgi:hypothetical protein
MKLFKPSLIILALALIGSLYSGCFPTSITGSGDLTSQDFSESGFTSLHVQNGFEIEVTQANSFSIEITADDNVMEFVEVFKEEDGLVIRLKPTRTYGSVTLRVVITMPVLLDLDISGGSRATLGGFSSTESLIMNISGSSSVDATISAGDTQLYLSGGARIDGELNVGDVEFYLAGGSQADVSGSGGNLKIEAFGGSDLNLADFTVGNANVELSGGSQADINPDGSITVNTGGSSKLYVRGQLYTP